MVWWTGLVECGICRERHVQVIEIPDGDAEPLRMENERLRKQRDVAVSIVHDLEVERRESW